MDEKDNLLDRFLELEQDLDLFNTCIKDVYIWDYVRMPIFMRIKSNIAGFAKSKTSIASNPFRGVYSLLKQCITILIHYKNYKIDLDYDIVFFGHQRRKKEIGYYKDIYSEIIFGEIRKSHSATILEFPNNFSHLRPTSNSIQYLDIIELKMAFAPFFSKLSLTEREISKIDLISNNLNNAFNTKIDFLSVFKKALKQYNCASKDVNRILERSNQKCLIFVDAYNFIKKVFIEKANKKSIPTIELQHGSITSNHHIAYHYNCKEEVFSFPKYIFLWGNYWYNNLRLPPKSEAKIVGFPYLDQKKKTSTELKKGNNILVVSQWTIGLDLIKETNKLAHSYSDYKFYFKLHPSELKSEKMYESLITSKNIYLVKDDIDLYNLFSMCIAQIGVYSTVLVEGVAFNLKTFILPIKGYEVYDDFIEKEIMILLKDYKRFRYYLIKDTKRNNFKNELWKEDALINSVQAIKKVIKE